jgi:hypothetical protein
LAVPSRLPEIRRLPSRLKARPEIKPACPLRVRSSAPVVASQICAPAVGVGLSGNLVFVVGQGHVALFHKGASSDLAALVSGTVE